MAFHLGGRVLAFLELKTSASGSRRRGRAGGLGSTHLPALEDPLPAHGRVLAVSGARRSGAPWLLILLVGQEVVVAVPVLGPSQVLSSEQLGWKGQDAGLLQVARGPSRAQAGRPPAADTGRGRLPTYVGTGLSCCRHCHLGLCRRRWTQVPRRLVRGELARRFLAGPPSSSSCAGGRRARTPHPAPDTPHLGDTPARRLLSLHITLGLRAELGGGGGRTPPPPAIWVKQWKLAVPVGPVPTGTRGQCGARARGQDDGRGLWAWSTCSPLAPVRLREVAAGGH